MNGETPVYIVYEEEQDHMYEVFHLVTLDGAQAEAKLEELRQMNEYSYMMIMPLGKDIVPAMTQRARHSLLGMG